MRRCRYYRADNFLSCYANSSKVFKIVPANNTMLKMRNIIAV